jgi:hypothetical protein
LLTLTLRQYGGLGNDVFRSDAIDGTTTGWADRAWTIRNGDGDSDINIGSTEVARTLTIVNGTGDDVLAIGVSDFLGGGSISNGAGDTHTNVGYSSFGLGLTGTSTYPKGDFTFKCGDGQHTAEFVMFVGKDLDIATGGQADMSVALSTVYGNMHVRTGNLNDSLNLGMAQVHGAVSADLGGGDDEVSIDEMQFTGAFRLRTGAGNDTVTMEEMDDRAESVFSGPTSILMGAGDDSAVIGAAVTPQDFARFSSHVLFDGGAGVNTLAEGGHSIYASQPEERGF